VEPKNDCNRQQEAKLLHIQYYWTLNTNLSLSVRLGYDTAMIDHRGLVSCSWFRKVESYQNADAYKLA